MTIAMSRCRAALLTLAAFAAAALAPPADAYSIGPGTFTETFDGYPWEAYYLEDALPGAYVVDGYAEHPPGCDSCNGIFSSFDHSAYAQIDFYEPQDYVSFTNATSNGLHAWALTYLYGGVEPTLVDEILVAPGTGISNAVLTLRTPPTDDPDLYYPRISTIVFWGFSGPSGWAIDNLEWSAAVPEPAIWATMLAGFGIVGAALRTRRRPLVA